LQAKPSFTAAMIPPPARNGAAGAATVFLVDDDEAVRDSLTVLLEAAGLPVVAFASGRDFLAAYDQRQPGCLLLDLDLPDMTGHEVLRRLIADGVTLPVILITGRRSSKPLSQAGAADVVALLEKPFQEQVLLAAIHDALGTHAPGA
jgi:two-component system, LuxR family, response regulator FixJ